MRLFQFVKTNLTTTSLKQYFLVGLVLQCFLGLYKLFAIPRVLYDEALYSYTSLAFIENMSFYHDFALFAGKEFCLYPLLLALYSKCVGLSFETGRLFSFGCGVMSYGLFFKLIQRLNVSLKLSVIALIGFLSANTLFVSFRVIRPEALLILLVLCLFILLCDFCNNTQKIRSNVGLGFILAALSLTHFIGFLFVLPICVFIAIKVIYQKQYIKVFYLFCGALPILIILGLNINDLMGYQDIYEDIGSNKRVFPEWVRMKNNIKYFFLQNYILGFKRIYIVLVELCALIFGLTLIKRQPFIGIITIATWSMVILGFACIDNFLRPYYSVVPMVCLLIVVWVSQYQKKYQQHFIFFTCLYVLNHAIGNMYIMGINHDNVSFSDIKKHFQTELIKDIPVGGDRMLWYLHPRLDWIKSISQTNDHDHYYFYQLASKESTLSSLTKTAAVKKLQLSKKILKVTATQQLDTELTATPYGLIQRLKITEP
ncbi:hypothetical protein DID76_00785 [Candidatus Marinamargulisbacteria bacterium SCGC AG-414-C22]|nr:hypothetical protein DID76_00785 [Candidatus Marinamargulisbacteria bacterium SCGC AG-414-C22]